MLIAKSQWLELGMTAAVFFLIAVYHWRLVKQVRSKPLETAVGITNHVRTQWVRSVMQEENHLLAVQTLRNGLMAANFLASTAILISLGLLSVAFKPGLYNEISQALNLAGMRGETLWMFKLMLLSATFFLAFFNFTLTIRYHNHAGFMISILETHDPTVTPDTVADTLNHGALHYTYGMRAFYLSVPTALWLFGPVWMLCATMVLIWVLQRLDHTA
ncbi:MAG: DUF599 domain-containing protein [Desulfatitalea sp.]|nr:DUF599 domain-containing protein [Desulfatitalea sp.]NNJ98827.1 DUF599 domain-containing protein [Desulfatitalea sp.]